MVQFPSSAFSRSCFQACISTPTPTLLLRPLYSSPSESFKIWLPSPPTPPKVPDPSVALHCLQNKVQSYLPTTVLQSLLLIVIPLSMLKAPFPLSFTLWWHQPTRGSPDTHPSSAGCRSISHRLLFIFSPADPPLRRQLLPLLFVPSRQSRHHLFEDISPDPSALGETLPCSWNNLVCY